jgi:hypothetical protein
MREKQWLRSTDSEQMLKSIWKQTSERKVRLYACAALRRIWHMLLDPRLREAVETIEKFADGLAAREELDVAFEAAEKIRNQFSYVRSLGEDIAVYWYTAADAVLAATQSSKNVFMKYNVRQVVFTCANAIEDANLGELPLISDRETCLREIERRHRIANDILGSSALLREIIGNPFRRIQFERRWATSNVAELARTIYAERAFERMPILADALMDAGCDDADILDHCRADAPHMRGCWVVDLVLARE